MLNKQTFSVPIFGNQFFLGLPKPRPPPRPTGRLYRRKGCFKDRSHRAMGRILSNLRGRRDAVMRCFLLAARRGYRIFGVQDGGECFSGPMAHRTFNRYGRSNRCRNGKGGPWANDVYIIIRRSKLSGGFKGNSSRSENLTSSTAIFFVSWVTMRT